MLMKLHANAATTPKVRAYIQASPLPVAELARELGVSETTVSRWKGRQDTADRPSTPKTLATRLCVEEAFVKDYNRTRLRCLGHKAPAELLYNLPGYNTFTGMSGFEAAATDKTPSTASKAAPDPAADGRPGRP